MEKQLFSQEDIDKNWFPDPSKFIIPNRKKEEEKIFEIFISPVTHKKNRAGGPIPKQSYQTFFFRNKEGQIITKKTKNGKEIPASSNYVKEPMNSGAVENKRQILEVIRKRGLPMPLFKHYVFIKYLYFVFPIPSSYTKQSKIEVAKGNCLMRTTKPDHDNLTKYVQDLLENLNPDKKGTPFPVIKNDGIVVGVTGNLLKMYGKKPGTYLKLYGL